MSTEWRAPRQKREDAFIAELIGSVVAYDRAKQLLNDRMDKKTCLYDAEAYVEATLYRLRGLVAGVRLLLGVNATDPLFARARIELQARGTDFPE